MDADTYNRLNDNVRMEVNSIATILRESCRRGATMDDRLLAIQRGMNRLRNLEEQLMTIDRDERRPVATGEYIAVALGDDTSTVDEIVHEEQP